MGELGHRRAASVPARFAGPGHNILPEVLFGYSAVSAGEEVR